MKQKIILVCLLFFVLNGIEFSQSAARPDRGLGAKVPYQSSDIDNINLQNGNVSLTIPLASLPPVAGGKLGYTLNAVYNSKLWDTYSEQRLAWPLPNEEGVGPAPFEVEKPRLSSTGGWSIGGAYGISVELASSF